MTKRKKYQKPNELLLEQASYTGDFDNPTEVRVISYNEEDVSESILDEGEMPVIEDNSVTWIRINGMVDVEWISRITESQGIPRLVLLNILRPQSIAGIETYEDFVQVNIKYMKVNENDLVESEHLTIILGDKFVITFQESDKDIFKDILNALALDTIKLRSKSANFLFLLLMNHILSDYLVQLNHLRDDFENMEDELLESYNTEDDFTNRLKIRRKIYQIFKQSIIPLKENFRKIQENEFKIFDRKDKIYISTVRTQFDYLSQVLEACRELFDVLLNLYISNNDLRMNEIMKRLTVISAIFIPLTFLAGVWGMNYEVMPELKARYGYLVAWMIMVFVGLFAWWYMKKRKWY